MKFTVTMEEAVYGESGNMFKLVGHEKRILDKIRCTLLKPRWSSSKV